MSRMDESIETDSRLMVVSIWGKRNGVCAGFPFKAMEIFWNLREWWLCDIANILHINELFTLKWLISYYVNLTSINYYLKNSQ